MSPPHALSCFTSTASPATLPACTSSLAALPSLAALFFSCSTSVTCSTFLLLQHFRHLQHLSSLAAHPSLAARLHLRPADLARPVHVLPAVLHRSRHPPSCASYRPSCDCSTCGPPTSACCTCTAPAFFLFHGTCSQHERTAAPASTAPPDTTRCCACVFLSVPRQMRLVLSTFGTEVSSPPLCCTPRDGAAAPAAGDICMLDEARCCFPVYIYYFIWVLATSTRLEWVIPSDSTRCVRRAVK